MKVLVTGGAGFIGSHLTELLLAEEHEVTVVDNLSTGSLENLVHLEGHPRLEVIVDSALNQPRMNALVPRHDIVFHLAAAVGVKWIIENPLQSIETNLRATEIVLAAAAQRGTPVLIASTSEVYGKNERVPLREDDDSVIGSTQITRWLYANTKATDEFLALAYHRERGVPVVIARFFNTVGPRQSGRYGMVVPRFVSQALRGEPVTIYGTGMQSRCFTDVRDSVRAIYELMRHPRAFGEVFNIGNPEEITILDLAKLILRLTGSTSEIQFIPYHEAYPHGFEDMLRRVPCVEKLRSYLGWAPSIPLEENLRRVIDQMRTTLVSVGGS